MTQNNTLRKFQNIVKLLKGDVVVLFVEKDTLVVDAGNKSAEDVKNIASTFFKSAYKLTS